MQSKTLYKWVNENWDKKIYPTLVEFGLMDGYEMLSVSATRDGVITANNRNPSSDDMESAILAYRKKEGLVNTKTLKLKRDIKNVIRWFY